MRYDSIERLNRDDCTYTVQVKRERLFPERLLHFLKTHISTAINATLLYIVF